MVLTPTDVALETAGQDWIAFRPVMVTDRNDEFIFEVQSKGTFLADKAGNSTQYGVTQEQDWRDTNRGRTLSVMGNGLEGRHPCLTRAKWRSTTNATTGAQRSPTPLLV